MTKIVRTALTVMLSVAALFPLTTGGVEVVANATLTESRLPRTTIRAIFMGSITRWNNGHPIAVFVLPPEHPATKSFAWDVLKMTPYAFEEKISSMVATRDGNPPRTMSTEIEMLRSVASTPNSIGYLSTMIVMNNANSSLRVVPIL
jgi:ABC-type phosphate transport system substrate-binding protein